MDIQQGNDGGLRELALFAGAGGGILGGKLLGWRTVCAVEREAYPAAVLAQRQNDGLLDIFPIWSDVTTFDGKPWRGRVDVVSGGFPCQDISAAGKGAGIDGERSGMWSEMARIVREIQPRFVFVENSPILTSRGLGRVLGDLAAMGFDAEWGVLAAGSSAVGASHIRERIWILAYSDSHIHPINNRTLVKEKREFQERSEQIRSKFKTRGVVRGASEPELYRADDGLANKMDRIKCVGNGQVPQCSAEAFTRLMERIT